MKRLTGFNERTGQAYIKDYAGYLPAEVQMTLIQAVVKKCWEYENTGLEPEEVKAAKTIAERIATADFPHDFQRERSDIAAYLRWITDVMRDAKAWWNSRIHIRAEAEGGADSDG